ncbi:MAG: AraC family transcriptional regulator [Pseudomonadota bacterium]
MELNNLTQEQNLDSRMSEMHESVGIDIQLYARSACNRFSTAKAFMPKYSGTSYGSNDIFFMVLLDGTGQFRFDYDAISFSEYLQPGDVGVRYGGLKGTGEWPDSSVLYFGLDKATFETYVAETTTGDPLDLERLATSKIQSSKARYNLFDVVRLINSGESTEEIELAIDSLTMALLDLQKPLHSQFTERPLTKNQLNSIHQRIMDCKDDAPSASELALLCSMSRSHFSRAFKRTIGMSPYQFVVNQRMKLAASLLRDGNINVSQTSLTLGYENPAKFSAAFKKSFGVLPMRWKNA